MRTQALRILILAAIGAYLAGALGSAAFADPAGVRTTPSPGTSWTGSPRPTSYRPDGSDTGPPTPGPTDPNGPLS
jgi:hypothetical protein